MKRPDPSTSPSSGSSAPPDTTFAAAYPVLWTYLTDTLWDDGKPRESSALSWTWSDGMWQAALNDKALKRSLYTSGSTQKEVLKLMERALADGSGVWRPWKRGK